MFSAETGIDEEQLDRLISHLQGISAEFGVPDQLDFFAHSGTVLIAGELSHRRVYTFDIDPIFAEITIRRLEHYRKTSRTGWQWHNPFPEIEAEKSGF